MQDNGALDLPWQTLNDEEQTVVFYMGIKSLPIITQQLVKVGRAMSTPAALIRKGTHANQQVIKGTIETLESLVILHHIKPPSLIVIGNVVDTFADSQLKNLGYLSPIDNK
ncbi:uroporphyrinogen-III C-methyltransferase [Colwellia maritima]|uniref:uroporphyrinogen-III C-methyltransferase n=1 Tax=Colwellia maritima TaxID=2912588 RepID=UPI003B848129